MPFAFLPPPSLRRLESGAGTANLLVTENEWICLAQCEAPQSGYKVQTNTPSIANEMHRSQTESVLKLWKFDYYRCHKEHRQLNESPQHPIDMHVYLVWSYDVHKCGAVDDGIVSLLLKHQAEHCLRFYRRGLVGFIDLHTQHTPIDTTKTRRALDGAHTSATECPIYENISGPIHFWNIMLYIVFGPISMVKNYFKN